MLDYEVVSVTIFMPQQLGRAITTDSAAQKIQPFKNKFADS